VAVKPDRDLGLVIVTGNHALVAPLIAWPRCDISGHLLSGEPAGSAFSSCAVGQAEASGLRLAPCLLIYPPADGLILLRWAHVTVQQFAPKTSPSWRPLEQAAG